MAPLHISELAHRSGTPASTLRYYDDLGLLPAERSPAGYRLYDERALERLAFIRTAKDLGLGLTEITEVLDLWDRDRCAQVRDSLRRRVAARLDDATERAAELERFRTLLRRGMERLREPVDDERCCDSDCPCVTAADPGTERSLLPLLTDATEGCALDDDALAARLDDWRDLLVEADAAPTPNGRTWTWPLARAGSVAALAAEESACCAFFDLSMDFTPGGVRLHVRVDPARTTGSHRGMGAAVRLLAGVPAGEDTTP